MAERKRVLIQLREDLYNQLKEMSHEYDVSMSKLCSQIISQHLNAHKKMYDLMTSPEMMMKLQKQAIAQNDTQTYEYEVQADYGKGWETVTTEPTEQEAKEMLETYISNDKKATQFRYVKTVKLFKDDDLK